MPPATTPIIALRKCPTCGKQKLVRLMSAQVFRLKGAGWYETDFKSEAERKRNLAEYPDKEVEKKPEETAKAEDKTKEPAEQAAATAAPAAEPAKAQPAAVRKAATSKPVKKKAALRKAAAAKRRVASR